MAVYTYRIRTICVLGLRGRSIRFYISQRRTPRREGRLHQRPCGDKVDRNSTRIPMRLLKRSYGRSKAGLVTGLAALVIALPLACDKRSTGAGDPFQARPSSSRKKEGPPFPVADLCKQLCRVSDPLQCPKARDCLPSCTSMMATSVCGSEVRRFLTCLANQSVEHWECDEEGVAAIRDPFCEPEQAATATCLEQRTRP